MKKVLITYYCDKNGNDGWLKQFSIVEDIVTKLSTIKAEVVCIDGVKRTLDYLFSAFEYEWKINLSEIELPKCEAYKI